MACYEEAALARSSVKVFVEINLSHFNRKLCGIDLPLAGVLGVSTK
jgi:hypothetical protein